MHSMLSQRQPRMYQPYCNVRQRLRPLRAAGCGTPVPAGAGAATPHASASTGAALASAAAWRCHRRWPTSLRQMAYRHGAAQPQAPAAAELRSAAAALRGRRGATLDSARSRAYGRRNFCRCLVDSTALPVAQPQQLRELAPPAALANTEVVIRTAAPADYWAIAEVHCGAFYPREPPGMMHELLRLDRVLAISAGVHAARNSERRRYRCLIAYRRPAGGDGSSRWPGSGSGNGGSSGGDGSLQAALLRHYWGFWRAFVPGPVTAGLGADFDALQIVGAAAVDTLGDHTPPKRLPSGVKKQRQKMAYVSNVAVAPGARRQGVAAALLREAEQLAAEWGCTSALLHVDADNAVATGLYAKARYRLLAPPRRTWFSFTDPHSGKRMMLKRLPAAGGSGRRDSGSVH